MSDCTNEIGPDSLEFTHRGKPAGGICDRCIASAKGVRVLFKRDKDGNFIPAEMFGIDNPL